LTRKRDTVAAAEEAELRELRDRVEQSRHDVGDTVAALADRVTATASPGIWARRQAAEAKARARRSVLAAIGESRDASRRLGAAAGRRVDTRTAIAGLAFGVTIAAAIVARRVARGRR
jgi:hypothetical protein